MNYYEILGVNRDATIQEIKKAYKKLAKKWHPDLNRDNIKVAEEKMKEINVAYTTLSDEVARIDYNKKLDAESKKSSSRTGATSSAQSETPRTSRKTTAGNSSAKIDFQNMQSSFESFFGFNPHTKEVTNEDKLNTYTSDRKKKNPLDTTDFFEKFMGFKI
ncbi:MAG: DnaJ domain-containing protein [Selenomonadaceae bacterium]|nr:DnaJ domain-containing protein [Selenomonadaceae bacterium]